MTPNMTQCYFTGKKKRNHLCWCSSCLFIACPSCVGSILSVFAGVAGGIVLTAALAQLQTLFIAASIPILAVMPFIIASRLEKNVCEYQTRQILEALRVPDQISSHHLRKDVGFPARYSLHLILYRL